MAWQFCHWCDHQMGEPDVNEVVAGAQACPECGHEQHPLKSTDDLLIELYDRIVALEAIVNGRAKGDTEQH